MDSSNSAAAAPPASFPLPKKVYGWQSNTAYDRPMPTDDSQAARLLRLKIFRGHNLAKKDIFGASDPYVRIDLLESDRTVIDSVYTKTKKKTLNPCWNEEFIFRVIPSSHQLLIEVFDENRLTRDDFLGKVELSLDNIVTEAEGETIEHSCYVLQQRSQKSKVRGHLEIYHAYLDYPASRVNSIAELSIDTDESDSEWELVDRLTTHPQGREGSETEELPTGWEECQDTNGRTYFVNHTTRTTQWERPTRPAAEGQLEEWIAMLEPSNQQMRQQSYGRRYHIGSLEQPTGETHSDAPSLSDSADELPPRAKSVEEEGDENRDEEADGGTQSQSCNTTITSLADLSLSRSEANRRYSEPTTSIPSGDEPHEEDRGPASSEPPPRPHSHHHHRRHHHHHNHQGTNSESNNEQFNAQPSNGNITNRSFPSSSSSSSNRRADNPEDGLGPLPKGWTYQVAETGRIFFIDHNHKVTTWVDPRTGKPSPSPNQHNSSKSSGGHKLPANKSSTVDDLGPLPQGWEERVHRDGRIFFINHNTRTTQWEDPRIDNPNISGPPVLYSRDYKKKYEMLQNALPRPTNVPNKFEIKVHRNNILEDSFRIVNHVTKVDFLKTKLWIEFDNEEVLDYGGPCREWFYLLSKEMFNPYYGLFEYSSADKYTLQIKPNSGRLNEMHLPYFKFIGRVAGMAIFHGKLLDAFFIRPFYKMMLGKEITLKDMESVDSEYFNSLKYILENDPSELYLNFSIDEKFFDVVEEKELKPNGAQIPVTNENKHEYINLVIDWRFVSRVKIQMDAFLEGFHELIPKHLIEIFDENELELLMCGIGNVDVKDWKQNTVYKGGYHPNHIVIQWFWRVVLSFNNEMRSRLLQFVTGTSRVPMNGFKELYGSNGPQLFTIEKWGTSQNLPRSHTCFNRLDLPCYEAYSDLRDKLIKAIEGSESYGGVD